MALPKHCRGGSLYAFVDDTSPGFPSPEEAVLARGPLLPGASLVPREDDSMFHLDVVADGQRTATFELAEFANGWHVSGVEGCDLFRAR